MRGSLLSFKSKSRYLAMSFFDRADYMLELNRISNRGLVTRLSSPQEKEDGRSTSQKMIDKSEDRYLKENYSEK